MFRSRTVFALLFSAVTSFSLVASAEFVTADPGRFRIDGAAKPKIGPRLTFDGKGPVSAKDQGETIVFTADLARLDMGERTDHAKEDFECKKHPSATLVIEKSAIKLPEDKGKTEGEVSGKLTLRGQTKPVKVNYKISRTGSDFHLKHATFSFDYTQFGVKPICRFGRTICVEPKVKVSVHGLKLRQK